jgi:uncharacterized protein YajQ (UPF0234 family)
MVRDVCVDILHKIFETYENTHQIIIGADFNENILLLEGIESQRKKYINDFVSDHQLCAVKVGLTYCHTEFYVMISTFFCYDHPDSQI